MNRWTNEAARALQERAPLLTDAHARELAEDLYTAWPDGPPRLAIAKFFREIPLGWKTEPASSAVH